MANGYVKINTSFAPVLPAMDYTLNCGLKVMRRRLMQPLPNGRAMVTEFGGSLNLFSLGFEKGHLLSRNNGFKVQPMVIILITNGTMLP